MKKLKACFQLVLALWGWRFIGNQALPQETHYDDDTELDFVWTSAEGSFERYHVYVSVDAADYWLVRKPRRERVTINAQNGRTYKIKVAAATSEDLEGPFSPESDPVRCDTQAPPVPEICWLDRLDNSQVALVLSQDSPLDENFSHYQVRGGPDCPDWSDSSLTETFVFKVFSQETNVLEIRQVDLAGNFSQAMVCLVAGDGNVDSDNDGFTDDEEIIFGTSPSNSEHFPQLSVEKAGVKVRLYFRGRPKKIYQVQWSEDLIAWHDSGLPKTDAEETIHSFDLFDEPEVTKRFFRLAVFPPGQ